MASDIGKIRVVEVLGTGAGSQVVKVVRAADSKTYAMKIVTVSEAEDRKYVEQVRNEYEVTRGLSHEHLIKIYALEIEKKLFRTSGARLLMEYVDGLPLEKCPGLPLRRLAGIFYRVAHAMAYLNAEGIYHADIKPGNILIGRQREVKVIDLGLAWRRGENKDRVQGTLDYLAPEQAADKVVNGKTEVFNFGATMYHVLLGEPIPSEIRESKAANMGNIDYLIRPLKNFRSDVPDDLDELVRSCIKCDPSDRPRAMREVRDNLREIRRAMKKGEDSAGDR